MRSSRRSPLALFLLAALAACGRGDSRADGGEAAVDTSKTEDPRAVYGVAAARNVVVTPVEIELLELPPGWGGMRIAAISDFNLGLWADNEAVARAAVREAIAARPDLIVLLGDYVARGGDYAALDRVLAPLRGRRVLAVLGHRDADEDPEGPDSVAINTVNALTRNGVQVLRNTRAPVVRGGDTAYVAGLDPFVARRPLWRQAEIYGGIPGAPSTMLVLSHMPVAAVGMPRDKYPALIGGHTFCGQVEVPGTPRLSWFNTEVLPGTSDPTRTRIYRLRGATVFITCGIGYSFVPVRFGHPPEVALVTLRAVGPPQGAAADSAQAAQANVDSLIRVFQERDTTAAAADTTG